jgi:hypothetical protein
MLTFLYTTLKFYPDKTIFSFSCPITPVSAIISSHCIDQKDFKLPSNVQTVALDDSKIQRKLLARYFMYAGVPETRITIMGESTNEIEGFKNWALNFIVDHPDDYILFIVDENLDIHEDLITSSTTISGSSLVSQIRQELLPENERKILAIVRSANDSADDVAIYNSRAHGCIPKAPIKPAKVLEEIAPHWLLRFPPALGVLKEVRSKSFPLALDDDEGLEMNTIDLEDFTSSISDMVSSEEEALKNWKVITEKLHLLKGDLLTLSTNTYNMSSAVDMINEMRASTVPQNLKEQLEILLAKITRKA